MENTFNSNHKASFKYQIVCVHVAVAIHLMRQKGPVDAHTIWYRGT